MKTARIFLRNETGGEAALAEARMMHDRGQELKIVGDAGNFEINRPFRGRASKTDFSRALEGDKYRAGGPQHGQFPRPEVPNT